MATHTITYKRAMREVKRLSTPAHGKLAEQDPKVWSKAFFETYSKTNSVENNMSNCFNAWIIKARYMPVLQMLAEIHDQIIVRLHQKRDAMMQIEDLICPRI